MFRPARFARACATLSAIIRLQAHELQEARGRGWTVVPADVAPADLTAVTAAWQAEAPFPVSSEGLAGSVYGCPETNAAFRFVHDSLHARHGYAFDTAGELQAARHHLQLAAIVGLRMGYSLHDVVCALAVLWCDTAGQALYHADTGGLFLTDQAGTVAEWYATNAHRCHNEAGQIIGAAVAALYR